MTMALRVFIEEITAAKLEQHVSQRGYLRPSANAVTAARLAQETGAGALSPVETAHAGSVPARQTSANLDTGTANPGATAEAGSPRSTAPALFPLCEDCAWLRGDGDGPCATHRRACEGCGRGEREGVALHDGDISKTKLGPAESRIVERWCDHCDPGGDRGDGLPDPWDLSDEELITTCDLPREAPAYYGRDRADYDPADDKSDIQPHERTTR